MAAGIIKELKPEDREYYTYKEVMVVVGVSRSKAYQMISSMNKQLKEEGKMFVGWPSNRIPKNVFRKMCMLD